MGLLHHHTWKKQKNKNKLVYSLTRQTNQFTGLLAKKIRSKQNSLLQHWKNENKKNIYFVIRKTNQYTLWLDKYKRIKQINTPHQ